MLAFFGSDYDEARVRMALGDAAPFYRDSPEAREARVSGASIMQAFMQEALPRAADETRTLSAALMQTTLSAVGRRCSQTLRTQADIERHACATAEMFCAYINSLGEH